MKNIPVRHITPQNETTPAGSFKIRKVSDVLEGKDLAHALHKHDFYFILALKKGAGNHDN